MGGPGRGLGGGCVGSRAGPEGPRGERGARRRRAGAQAAPQRGLPAQEYGGFGKRLHKRQPGRATVCGREFQRSPSVRRVIKILTGRS